MLPFLRAQFLQMLLDDGVALRFEQVLHGLIGGHLLRVLLWFLGHRVTYERTNEPR